MKKIFFRAYDFFSPYYKGKNLFRFFLFNEFEFSWRKKLSEEKVVVQKCDDIFKKKVFPKEFFNKKLEMEILTAEKSPKIDSKLIKRETGCN